MAVNIWKQQLDELWEVGCPEEKSAFLEQLQGAEDPDLIEPLVDLLEVEKDRALKERILIVLTQLVPATRYIRIDRMLRSPDPFVRNGIVEILKKSQQPLEQFLSNLAEDPDKDVRKFVIDALSQENTPEVIEIIRSRLVDTDINIVYTAVEYLGNFRDQGCVNEVEGFLLSPRNIMLTCSSLVALSKIGNSPKSSQIVAMYGDMDNPMVIFPFLKYLAVFGQPGDLAYVEAMLRRRPETMLKEIVDAIIGIISKHELQDLPESLREVLLELGETLTNHADRYEINKLMARLEQDDTHSLERVREMLGEPDVMVLLSAVEILGNIGEESDIERLEELASESYSDELLEAIGDAVMKIDERLNG